MPSEAVTLDPFAESFFVDPYPVYQRLRDEAPVYHDDSWDFWALSRYDDVVSAYRDVETFSNTYGATLDDILSAQPHQHYSILSMDPPEHALMRRLVNKVFTPRAVAALEPMMNDVITGHLDRLADRGEIEVVTEFCALFPAEIIARMLGFPKHECHLIREWTDLQMLREPGNPNITQAGLDASATFRNYALSLVAEKRRRPGDDILSRLCTVTVDRIDGRPIALTDDEIADFALQLGGAGSETTTKLVSTGLVLLHRHPDQWRTLVTDPGRIPSAIEEVLRFWSPVQYNARFTLRPSEFHGQAIPARSPVVLLIGAANRDERTFDDPDRFDTNRPSRPSLGFGHGIHFCLGASLARQEARIAFSEIARRWPTYTIDESGCESARMTNVLGFSAVPMQPRG